MGLKLPTASGTGPTGGELVFKVDASINDLDQTWAPSDGLTAGSLYDLSLIYNPQIQVPYHQCKSKIWENLGQIRL